VRAAAARGWPQRCPPVSGPPRCPPQAARASASNCGHPLLHRALRIRQHAALEFRDRCEERTNLAGECRGDTRGAEEGPPGIREAGVYGEELGASKVDDNLVSQAKQYTAAQSFMITSSAF